MITTDRFLINGKPLLCPDAGVHLSVQDLDAADAGRDQAGFLHRIVVRYKVPTWSFSYSVLTQAEKAYLDSLFPDTPTFLFTHPSRTDPDAMETTECYRSRYSLAWQNAVTGLWRDLKFDIIGV